METMDSTIIASIIGAIATIVAVIISPFIVSGIGKRKKEKFTPISTLADKQLLYGRWIGVYDQKSGKEEFQNEHKAIILFTPNSEDLSGTIKLSLYGNSEKIVDLYLVNTILEDRVFKSDYVNKNVKALHFGTILGEVSGNGNEINGKFLGYGIDSERVIVGNIKFIRDKTYIC